MKTALPPEVIHEYFLDSPLLAPKRRATGPYDFGDIQTVGLRLKKDKPFAELELGEDFGLYLGEHDHRFVVMITDCDPPIGESFDSLEELKSEWRLD